MRFYRFHRRKQRTHKGMRLHPEQLPAPRHNGAPMMDERVACCVLREDEDGAMDHSAYREAVVMAQRFYKQVFAWIKSFRGQRGFAVDIAMYGLGWDELLDAHSQVELARKWKCTKANVEKALGQFQEMCGVPERGDQRDARGRLNMTRARIRQLRG